MHCTTFYIFASHVGKHHLMFEENMKNWNYNHKEVLFHDISYQNSRI